MEVMKNRLGGEIPASEPLRGMAGQEGIILPMIRCTEAHRGDSIWQ